MRKFPFPLLLSLAAMQPLFGSESLTIKRISEFWKDKAYDQAQIQILQFLAEYPASEYCDNLYAMLGDLYLQENEYAKALAAYDQIIARDIQNKSEPSYLQALFGIGDYHSILKRTNKNSSDPKIHYLSGEAAFRLGNQTSDPERQKTLYVQAASHYSLLADSTYADDVLSPLAEIYKNLGETPKAASLYLELAEKKPEAKAALLFEAAYLQTGFDKRQAANTFERVYELRAANVKNAAFNYLLTLFEMEEFREFLTAFERAQDDIPQEARAGLQFYASKSYFALGEIEKAVASLEKCEGKLAYLLLAGCAEKLGDMGLLAKATNLLSEHFPKDIDTAKAHLISAQINIDRGDILQAQNNLEYVLKHFPEYPEKEKLLCDYATLLSRNHLWEKSRIAFQELLNTYPETSYKKEAWRYLLNASLKEGKRDAFTTLLEEALTQTTIFSSEEEKSYHLLLIKLLIEQQNKEKTTEQLTRFLDHYPDSAEGHLVAAHFYVEDPMIFQLHAEQALSLDPYLPDSQQLHLILYNIYIQTSGEQEKAARHLYHLVTTSNIPIKEENLQWLAGHYFNKKEHASAREKALFLYEKITARGATPENEKDFLKYAELLNIEKKGEECIKILEHLTSRQLEEQNLFWKLQRQALFELAKAYTEAGETRKAVLAYDTLINTSTHMPSYFSRAALLERARLQYQLLSPSERQENNPSMTPILSALKDLQLKKKLHSEPIHLEAALDYVEIMRAATPEEEQLERTVFLLRRVKHDFSSKDDIHSKEYHSQLSILPDKAATLEAYLDYIDAEILRLKGKTNRAKKLYQMLQERPLDPSLQKRINTSMVNLYDAN